jgi:hypothetical protein
LPRFCYFVISCYVDKITVLLQVVCMSRFEARTLNKPVLRKSLQSCILVQHTLKKDQKFRFAFDFLSMKTD